MYQLHTIIYYQHLTNSPDKLKLSSISHITSKKNDKIINLRLWKAFYPLSSLWATTFKIINLCAKILDYLLLLTNFLLEVPYISQFFLFRIVT